nr:CAP domain-containing protein [Streptomyces smaragdinus]
MLGASAAVAVGALAIGGGAVGSGLAGGQGPDSGGPSARADGAASLEPQSGGQKPTSGPSESPSASPTEKATPSKKPSAKAPAPKPSTKAPAPTTAAPAPSTEAPAPEASKPAEKPTAKPVDTATAAEAEVLRLVNQERAKAGCQPVTADAELAALAGAYSADMAARGFFDHTDPDGDDPWERAEAAGVSNVGGENIARGQANAQSVMDAWMASEGHRANILNCDFKTLGVGAYFASGGPWWTQSFGY